MVPRDVDGHIGRKGAQRIQQDADLDTGPAAELDQGRARPDRLGDLPGIVAQNPDLGPGRVILGQVADAVEQP